MSTSPPSFYNPIPATQKREVLRENPDLRYFQQLNYSEVKYRDIIRQEIQERWVLLNNGKSRDPITNEGRYRKIKKQVRAKYQHLHREHRARTLLWLQSERTLNLLRTKGQTPTPTQDQLDAAMMRFVQRLDLSRFPEIEEATPHLDPNQYFRAIPATARRGLGLSFFSTVVEGAQQGTQHERIIGINTDFWAAFLGGDKRLGHDLLFLVSEDRFYFNDLVAGCYVPTTVEKVRLVASQALQQRAYGQDANLASTILVTFRTKKVFDEIIAKAKAVLAAEAGFFDGQDARPRWQNTRHKVQVDSTIATFVKEQVQPADGHVLTVGECLLELGKRGEIPLNRKEKTVKINDAIRELFKRGLRNDLRLEDNRQVSGWRDLKLRDDGTVLEGGLIRDTDESGTSAQCLVDESSQLAMPS